MGTARLHAGKQSVWQAIDQATKKGGQIVAAIGYLSDATALPLKKGDILIANLSEKTIRSGASTAEAAAAIVKSQVQLFSKPGLHAKIVLADGRLFVGSMNASVGSRSKLIEGALETTDRKLCSDAARWLRSLMLKSTRIGRAEVAELKKIPRPTSKPVEAASSSPETGEAGRPPKTWILFSEAHEELDEEQAARKAIAEGKELPEFNHFMFDVSEAEMSDWRGVRKGDSVIDAQQDGREATVFPPGVVWTITEPKKKRRQIHTIYPKRDNRRILSWSEFQTFAKKCKATKLRHWHDQAIAQIPADKIERDWPLKKPKRRKRK
jgi:hypothetical protein